MRAVAFTIVTTGETWNSLESEAQQELTRWLQGYSTDSDQYQAALQSVQIGTALSPATGRVVAVGVQDLEREVGVIYTELAKCDEVDLPAGWQLRSGDEAEMLSWFWGGVQRYEALVSFAGRSFGLPFLSHRAVRHEITPVRSFFGMRRLADQRPPYHVDLQDELSYYGAMRKRLSLPMWCRAYDLSFESLRAEPAHIREWCTAQDACSLTQHTVAKLQATSALYRRWCAHLAPVGWVTQRSDVE